MTDEERRNAIITETFSKYVECLCEWHEADMAEKAAAAAKQASYEKYQACLQVGKLFGFDLEQIWQARIEAQAKENQLFGPPPERSQASSAAPTPTPPKPKTIREHAIEAAEKAYPNAVRAGTIRKNLEEIGIKTHEKTVGMTLYRLLKDGVLRRDGWDWFFVPADQRNANSKAKEAPGGEAPGDVATVMQ